jgi:hypothetical protein
MIFQDSRDGQNSKQRTEIPKQVRDDNKKRVKPSCHAEPVSASGVLLLASPEAPFIPVPAYRQAQDRVFQIRF